MKAIKKQRNRTKASEGYEAKKITSAAAKDYHKNYRLRTDSVDEEGFEESKFYLDLEIL